MTTALATPAARPTTPAHPRFVYSRLQLEWQRLRISRECLDQARAWDLPVGHVETLDDLLRAAGYGSVGSCSEAHDRVFVRLVELAHDDTLAARVVLQRMLPGLWSMARRGAAAGIDQHLGIREHDGDVLAIAWTVIRRFRLDHRQDHVAARMLKEIEYRAFRLPRRRVATFVPTSAEDLDRAVEAEPLGDAAVVLDLVLRSAARRGLAADDVQLLRGWGAGDTPSSIASTLSVTERTVRNRRAGALGRLQAMLAGDDCAGDAQGASRRMSSVSQAV